jgi:integrase
MSNSSVNKYLRRCGALFTWGKRHGYCHENPFGGLAIRRECRPHQLRERFTIEELAKLFDPANLHRDMRKSYMFWLPWLGLLTGARLEELCQLHLDDIRQEGGVWVFDINAKDEKRLKTLSSERLAPVHPRLVELGLLDHVEMLRGRGEKRLFPELDHRRDGYGQTASKWFGRYRERLGIDKPFHSLRHTFIDELHQLGADHKKIAALVGHADESMTGGRYSKPFRPDVMLPVVEMLKFEV